MGLVALVGFLGLCIPCYATVLKSTCLTFGYPFTQVVPATVAGTEFVQRWLPAHKLTRHRHVRFSSLAAAAASVHSLSGDVVHRDGSQLVCPHGSAFSGQRLFSFMCYKSQQTCNQDPISGEHMALPIQRLIS